MQLAPFQFVPSGLREEMAAFRQRPLIAQLRRPARRACLRYQSL
ncbi:MAG TPA: hypothetical protein VFV35_03695 [Acidimicrobiales bacterium]|nr:hypothetical protein [Acidimicrobiales bacterium]